MDFHTLLTACRQAKAWRGSLAPELKVAVNVSARPFQRPDFASHVAEVLEITGLPAAALELEITETVAMQDVGATLRVLRELHRLGVAIAIDDFGTGHSSLSYLRHFPIQTLKLDQSFVRDLPVDKNAEAIAQSVIMLAHSMRGERIRPAVTLQPQHPAVHIPHQIAAVDVGAESALDPLRHAAVGTGRGNAGEQRTDAEVHSAPLGVQARLIAGREQNRRRLAPAAATRVAQRRVVDLQAEHPALVGIAPEPHAGERRN